MDLKREISILMDMMDNNEEVKKVAAQSLYIEMRLTSDKDWVIWGNFLVEYEKVLYARLRMKFSN